MTRYRFHTIALLLLVCPLLATAQGQDYVIRDFHENITDMTAATSGIKDLNGVPAALLRFAVRDTLFEFDPNNGILKQENKKGEVWLYVPHGTKRITIRHPFLGVLRDYSFPVAISSKVTYDAEIIITNESYQQSLITSNREKAQQVVPVTPTDPVVSTTDDIYQIREEASVIPPKQRAPIKVHFLIGGGYNALSMQGPFASMGFEIGKFFIGADYVKGLDKLEGVGIYYKASGYAVLGEAYDYTASRASVRLGVNAAPDAVFQVIPQAGVSFNMIKGDEVANELGSEAQFKESNPISAFAAFSFQIGLGKYFRLHVTPQYDFAVAPDDVYKVLKEADKKIKSWAEGFSVNAGILLRF